MSFKTKPLIKLLGDKGYIRGPFGSALKRAELKDYGIAVYEQQHAIHGTRIFRYYIDDKKHMELKRFEVKANDLIISCSGTVGRISIIKCDDPVGIISQALLILRPNSAIIRPEFLYYFLVSQEGRRELLNASHGAVQQNIAPRNVVEKIEVPLPEPEVQDNIVYTLLTLDHKIEINRQINQTLEEMAQAIFKSWFVDFDPTRAKIAALASGGSAEDAERAAMRAISGKSDEELSKFEVTSSDAFNTLKSTAALFPSALQDSELGEIPEGWEVSNVGNIVNRLKPKKRYTNKQVCSFGETPVYEQGANILLGYHNDEPGFTASPEKPLFIFGDHTCITHLSCSNFDISQNVIPLEGNDLPTIWTYYAIKNKQSFQEYRRHWSEFIIKEVITPNNGLAEKFTDIITQKCIRKECTVSENAYLSMLRDTLLPKLLSGEIDLSNIAAANDEVA